MLRQLGMRQRREFNDELGDFSTGDGPASRGEPAKGGRLKIKRLNVREAI
jgi:hypothetical protein